MNHNTQTIAADIKTAEDGIKMIAHLKAVMCKFRHHKLLNSKFIDALNEGGEYWAWLTKDTTTTTLTMRPRAQNKPEFRVYESSWPARVPITWMRIDAEIERYNYQWQLDCLLEKQAIFDAELIRFKEFYALVDNTKFICFDLWKVKSELRDMLDFATKNGAD